MIMFSFLAMLAAQQAEAPPQRPLSDPDPRPMRTMDPIDGPAPGPRAPAEARLQVQQFGACIANASTAKATTTLQQDFRSAAYRNALRALSANNSGCFKRRGRVRASNLLIAGAIAEGLLGRDTTPIGRRLVLAASRPAVATFAPSDAAAVCVVRSAPDDVARLFGSAPATPDEAEALTSIRALYVRCAGQAVESSDEGLRAMLATAAFRSVAGGEKAS